MQTRALAFHRFVFIQETSLLVQFTFSTVMKREHCFLVVKKRLLQLKHSVIETHICFRVSNSLQRIRKHRSRHSTTKILKILERNPMTVMKLTQCVSQNHFWPFQNAVFVFRVAKGHLNVADRTQETWGTSIWFH